MSQSGKAGLKVLYNVSLTHIPTSCHPLWALAGSWLTFFFIHLKGEVRVFHCFNRISSVISMIGHFPHGCQPGASLLWRAYSYLTFEDFLHLWFVDFVVYEMNPLSHDARQICVRHPLRAQHCGTSLSGNLDAGLLWIVSVSCLLYRSLQQLSAPSGC